MALSFSSAFSTAYPVYSVPGGGGGSGTGGTGGTTGGTGGTSTPPVISDPTDPTEGTAATESVSAPVSGRPTVRVPSYLISNIAFNRAPALAIWKPGGLPEAGEIGVSGTKISLRDGTTLHEIQYANRSVKEVVEDINANSQYFFAVELNQVPVLGTGALFQVTGDVTPDEGQVIRLNGHAINYQEETRLRLLMPYDDDRSLPWYARIDTGQVLKVVNGMRHVFSIPEYSDQPWSTHFGKPYVTMTNVRAGKVTNRILRVGRGPIYWWDNNIVLTINDTQQSPDIIADVDEENRLIYLTRDIEPADPVLVTYTYREKSFVYKGVNLNPTPEHLPQFIGQYVIFFVRPQSDSVGRTWQQTVFHSVAPTLEGAVSQIPLKDDEPLLLLGALQVRQANSADDVDLVDTRTRGGGIKDTEWDRAKKLNQAVMATTDRGNLDSHPYPGNAVIIVDLPDSVRTAMTKEELYDRLRKHIAVGMVPLVHFRDS